MNTQVDFRKCKRFELKSTALLEDEFGEHFSYGQISNYSDGGFCFRSDVRFKPGIKIKMRLDNPLFKAAPVLSYGITKWCKELGDDDSEYFYCVGVKMIS